MEFGWRQRHDSCATSRVSSLRGGVYTGGYIGATYRSRARGRANKQPYPTVHELEPTRTNVRSRQPEREQPHGSSSMTQLSQASPSILVDCQTPDR